MFTTNAGDFSHSGLATPNISEMLWPIPRFRKLAINPSHNLWHSVSKFRLQIKQHNNKCNKWCLHMLNSNMQDNSLFSSGDVACRHSEAR